MDKVYTEEDKDPVFKDKDKYKCYKYCTWTTVTQ